MPFKEGDIVIVTNKDTTNHLFPIGSVVTLIKTNVVWGNTNWWYAYGYPQQGGFVLNDHSIKLAMIPKPGVNCAF